MSSAEIIARIPVAELATGHTLIDGAGDRWLVTGTVVLPDHYSSMVTFNRTVQSRYLWDDDIYVITNGRPLAGDQ